MLRIKRSGSSRNRIHDFGRLRVFDDVVDGFLEGEKNVVAHLRRDGDGRQLGRHLGAITHAGQGQIFLRIFARIVDQPFQGVVGGIGRPDDFIQGPGCFARGLGNLLCVGGHLSRGILVRFRHFAQQCHLGEIGAELVVQVPGDARALPLQCFLMFVQLQLAPQFLGGKITHHGHDHSHQRQAGSGIEPPRLPELGLHHHLDDAAVFVPDPVFVAGDDMKVIPPWGNIVVIGHASIAFRPGGFVAFQTIFKPDGAGGGEIQAGVSEFPIARGRGEW